MPKIWNKNSFSKKINVFSTDISQHSLGLVHLIINFYLLSFKYTGEHFRHNINRICGLVDDTTYKKIIAALSEEISVTHVRLHTN